MRLDRPIEDFESVEGWAQGLRDQWGGDPLAEDPEKLVSLAAFCEFVDMDPDELLAFCFLRRKATGERFVDPVDVGGEGVASDRGRSERAPEGEVVRQEMRNPGPVVAVPDVGVELLH